MMTKINYSGYRFPPEIIQQATWLYVRFPLSFRDTLKICWRNAAFCPTPICSGSEPTAHAATGTGTRYLPDEK
jgi:hypothetical protein